MAVYCDFPALHHGDVLHDLRRYGQHKTGQHTSPQPVLLLWGVRRVGGHLAVTAAAVL
jgi:hypothetical protein